MSENKVNIIPRARFIADGATTDFFYNFNIFTPEDMDVYLNEQLQATGYEIICNESEGGKVIFATPPQEGIVVTIIRNLELKRTSDFQEGGAFRAKVINHELDYQVASLQQLNEKITRTVTFPPYMPIEADVSLPTPQAGTALIWNQEENTLINSNVKIDMVISDITTIKNQAQEAASQSASSANNSKNSAVNSAGSCSKAAESATESANQAELARKYAEGTIVETPNGSAKFWSEKSEAFANTVDIKNRISNCVISCEQNPFLAVNGLTFNLVGKIACLAPDGLDANTYARLNECIISEGNISKSLGATYANSHVSIFLQKDSETDEVSLNFAKQYFEQNIAPTGFTGNAIWFNPIANEMKITYDAGANWTKYCAAKIADIIITNNVITAFSCKLPYQMLTQDDLISIKNEYKGFSHRSFIGTPIYTSQWNVGSGFVAPTNGWLNCILWTNGSNRYIRINGIIVASLGSGGNAIQIYQVAPIKKGDTVTAEGTNLVINFVPQYAE